MDPKEESSERAGPDRDDDERRLLRRLRAQFELALDDISELEPFASLERGPLQLFERFARHWSPDAREAFPSQETLARRLRVSSRIIREWTATLERSEIVVLRRTYSVGSHEHLFYAPGPATLAALRTFAAKRTSESGPRMRVDVDAIDRIEELERELEAERAANQAMRDECERVADDIESVLGEAAAVRIRCIAEAISGTAAPSGSRSPVSAVGAGEVNSLSRSEEPSSSSDRAHAREEEKFFQFSAEERALALAVLAKFHARRFPSAAPRKAFAVDELAMVVRCARELQGDHLAKFEAAMEAAWLESHRRSSRPPRPVFIFGDVGNFLAHVEAGERRLRALERRPTSPPREAVARPIEPDELADVGDVLEQLKAIGMG